MKKNQKFGRQLVQGKELVDTTKQHQHTPYQYKPCRLLHPQEQAMNPCMARLPHKTL